MWRVLYWLRFSIVLRGEAGLDEVKVISPLEGQEQMPKTERKLVHQVNERPLSVF